MATKLTADQKREKRNARRRYNTALGNARRITESLLQAIDAVLAQPSTAPNKEELEEVRTASTKLLRVLPKVKPVLSERTWRALEELLDLAPSPFPGNE